MLAGLRMESQIELVPGIRRRSYPNLCFDDEYLSLLLDYLDPEPRPVYEDEARPLPQPQPDFATECSIKISTKLTIFLIGNATIC